MSLFIEEVRKVSDMAEKVAVAEKGAPDAQTQVQDLHVILDVVRAMAAPTELDNLLVLILESARRLLHAERADPP